MRPPRMSSVIERRLLVNYRVDPAIATTLMPPTMRPQLVNGWAVAGICLIRLGQFRPSALPGWAGLRTENAAHRIAVEWDGPQGHSTGVYIARRDSGSLINVLAGGRLFPGEHNAARFDVRETARDLHVAYRTRDETISVSVDVRTAEGFQSSELFADLAQASEFFRQGSAGFSATRGGQRLDGLELRTDAWQVEPVDIRSVRSTIFDDPDRFPPGSAKLDCALLMRQVPATWQPLPPQQLVADYSTETYSAR
ncbi:DUF2071 domain-containing protein [Nocardia sp. CS682]|uniref:DUF2071 domain-containing protein n=1 Tax=Nocardia sp. CS682 TaxID=1047172 RepID=UPI0010754DA5|nr:DUF2071 domain-containing protein [Nocardia sp. CS682]QBS45319.1 hypothetical protein DMB37_39820 [Nocardia sp. CS682]